MKGVNYKGYTIVPDPHELQDGSGWDQEFFIEDHSGGGVTSTKHSPDAISKTEEEAIDACIARGKAIIDDV